LKITEQADGTFRAEGDNPMQGTRGRPVSVVYSRPEVKLVVGTGTGAFEGEINAANTEISGVWTQGGQSTPAFLQRADYQADHAQDAVKEYTFYSSNDLQGHWKGSWVVTIANVKATIRFALDLAKLPDGSYSAALANIDEFGYDAPVPASEFHYQAPNLRMKWKWAETSYEGRLENGKIVGTWFQGGGGFPLVFERNASQ
jgi:hypothetical protein